MISIRPTTREAYELFHEGSLALAEAEYNGIRCDQDYCKHTIAELEQQYTNLIASIDTTEIGQLWRKYFGRSASYTKDIQLRKVLYEGLGIKPTKYTKGGKDGKSKKEAVDQEVLSSLDRPDVQMLLEMKKITSNVNFLKNIFAQSLPDGYIHPFYHLSNYDDEKDGGARSFRGSSSDPNFQNNPNRDEISRMIVRRGLKSRYGYRLVGRDYGSMEFRISACLHHDPNMIRYIEHGDDPHRDVAAHCFLLDPELCTKQYGSYGKNVRHVGKNKGTFAQMYFQEAVNTARGLWNEIFKADLRVPSDPDKHLLEHLKDKGIRNYDAFESHIVRKVVPWFWKDMFSTYGKWRDNWLADYDKNGYFDMVTGFRVEGVLSKYQLGNYPIQGPAFHCLLWSMIQVNKLWKKRGWKSLVVGQIHDELVTDEHADEFDIAQQVVPRIMAEDIRKAWPWIIIPLEVESSATPVDGSWYEKRGVV